MKKPLKIILGSIVTLGAAFVFFLVWSTINDYTPPAKQIIDKDQPSVINKDTLGIMIWNIGYAGLGNDMDFFYDGGEKMQTSFQRTQKNLQAILSFMEQQNNVDWFLLQEVDVNSKRSYHINEKDSVKKYIPAYMWYYADNYKVNFVPVPLGNPLGKMKAGLMNGSIYKPAKVTRYSFEGNYAWPTSLFMLDRCFLVNAHALNNGDTLFIVNTHNTAYDDGGIRARQMNQMKKWLSEKYNNGNYVVVGGDWNQLPSKVKINHFGTTPKSKNYTPKHVPDDFLMDGWHYVYDSTTPTNRGLDTIFYKKSYKTVIDYFVTSPNIEKLQVKSIDLHFKNSDHQPVYMKFLVKR